MKEGKKETDDKYHPENGNTPNLAPTVAPNSRLETRNRGDKWNKKILISRTIESILWVIKYLTTPYVINEPLEEVKAMPIKTNVRSSMNTHTNSRESKQH